MRIDFSEPECCDCYHCRTSRIHNFQGSEPCNVIDSSITSIPVQAFGHDSAAVGSTSTSTPVEALGHDSAAVGSTTTSPPVEALGHDSAAIGSTSTSSPFHSSFCFGSVPVATTSVNSAPVEPLVSTISSGPSERPAFKVTFGSVASSAPSTSSASSPLQSSSPFRFGSVPAVSWTCSAPTQALGPGTFKFGGISAPTPGLETMQAPVQASASNTSTSFSFGPTHNFGNPVSASPTGTVVGTFARPDVGILPVTSSPTTSVVFGTTPVSVSSLFGPAQAPVQGSASNTFTFLPFGCVPSSPAGGSSQFTSVFDTPPASPSSNLFETNPSTTSVFGSSKESVHSQFGSKSGFNIHASPARGFSPFGSAQDFPSTTNTVCASSTEKTPPLSSFFPGFGVGYLPGSSSNLFRPNPSTTTPPFGGGSVFAGVKPSSPQHFGFLPSEGSRYPGYCPTPDGQPQNGMYMSISASDPYLHKSHEELRWEDYKQGCKGNFFSAPHASPISSRPNAAFSTPNVLPFPHMVPTTGVNPNAYPRGTIPDQRKAHFTGFVRQFPSSISPPSTTVPPTVGTTGVNFNAFPQGTIPSPNVDQRNAPFTGFVRQFPSSISPPSSTVPPMICTTGINFNTLPQGTLPSPNGFDQRNAPFTGFVRQFPSSISPSPTTVPPINSSVQRPHETATVSPPAPCCTACGATSSSSTSGHFTFNGATTPPSATTPPPGLFFPTNGFATTPPSATTPPPGLFFPTNGFAPMMFGTTLAVQGTTPALQAYPVQGYILLPFAAMSLQ